MNPVPPKINRAPNRTNAWLIGGLLALAALGAAVVIYWFNPATHAFYPVCQFHQLTGLNCPGCGMTRAVNALLHGHLAQALRDNLLLVLGGGVLLGRALWFGLQWLRGRPTGEFFPVKCLWLVLVAAVLFAVLRNLPGFAFLSP